MIPLKKESEKEREIKVGMMENDRTKIGWIFAVEIIIIRNNRYIYEFIMMVEAHSLSSLSSLSKA